MGDAIVARLSIDHKCQVGFNSETKLWEGNHAPLGAVWRCGTCGACYVRHEDGVRRLGALQWLPATRRELKAIRRASRTPTGDPK